jgi:hypothetical protein
MRQLFAAWMLLVGIATTANAATISDVGLVFGSTFASTGLTCKTLKVESVLPFTVGLAPNSGWPWHPGLTIQPLGGVGPATLNVCVDKGLARPLEVDHTIVAVTDANGAAMFDTRISCSANSRCGDKLGGGGPVPTVQPTVAPPRPTVTAPTVRPTPLPTRTGGPGPTTQPTAVPPSTSFRLPPLRPTTTDVRWEVLDFGYPLKWCPIREPAGGAFRGYVAATQTCMDALSEMSLNQMVKAIRVLRQVNNHWNATDFCLSDSQGASAITAFLNPIYEGNFGEYRGDWGEDWSGKDYGKPHYCQKKARAFLLANPVACAATTNAAETFDWLGIQVVNGKCVPLLRSTTFPETAIDKRFKAMGTINYDVRSPPLTGRELFLLHETHRCHAESSAAKCPNPPPLVDSNGTPRPPCSAGAAHIEFEASAPNESEHHRRVLKRFFNDPDPRHSAADICLIARLEDYDHDRWMRAVVAGDWAASRKAETDHQNSHFCMLLRDDRLLIRRTDCGDANVNRCPVETCAQVLARAEALMARGVQP